LYTSCTPATHENLKNINPWGLEKHVSVVHVLNVAKFNDASNEHCLITTCSILSSLLNILSSCIIPITPMLEDLDKESNTVLPM
jgi:hypothetical protein